MKYVLIRLLVIFLAAASCRSNESSINNCGFKPSDIDGPMVKQKLLEGREWVYQATLGNDTCFVLNESFPLADTADVFPFRFVVSDCKEFEMNFGIPLGGPFAGKDPGVTGACF